VGWGWALPAFSPLSNAPKTENKEKDFVDIVISKVLWD
jgi:hypothetical protein